MGRSARRQDPPVRRKQRIELQEGNITLRLLGVGLAIVVAVIAFGTLVNDLLTVQTGWQKIEAANPQTGIAEEFVLAYKIGAGNQSATEELKGVAAHYTEALEHAYRVLSDVQIENYTNLRTLNTHPNEEIQVDELLWSALETLEASGSRMPYYAPLFGQYNSLFFAADDSEAESFDPERNPAVGEFAAEVAAFAADPASVQVKLLPDSRVRLEVSEAYLSYAAENDVDSFLDFGILRNAFLVDAAVDALVEQGYTNGFLSSLDGYCRAMCAEELGVNVFDWRDGTAVLAAEGKYYGPAVMVGLRSFPVTEWDQRNYHVYSDGSLRMPYVAADGLPKAAASALSVVSTDRTAAQLALYAADCFAADTLDISRLEGLSWILVQDGTVSSGGNALTLVEE